jgi:hypothetical protein
MRDCDSTHLERAVRRGWRQYALLLLALLLAHTSARVAASELIVTALGAQSGRALGGVDVELTDRQGGTLRARTAADGSARFSGLAPGFYSVTAQAEARARTVEPAYRVLPDRISQLELRLPLLDVNIEEVRVVGVARGLQADPFGAATASVRNREELRSAVGAGPDVMRALDGLPGLVSDGAFAGFTVRGRGPRNNLVFVDDFPLDKVVHFDQTLGEQEDIDGGGRFSIFAPNSIASAEFSPGGWSAAYGGRSGSLLRLNLAEGGLTPVTSVRLDPAGAEFIYDGPSGIHADTSVFFTARRFDFGNVFELIGQDDIGRPEVTDVILKTATELGARDSVELLFINAPEKFTRDRNNVLNSDDFEDTSLILAEQDLSLLGLTWRRLVGEQGEWVNRFYVRSSDKDSQQGEAFPDLLAPGAPAAQMPVRADIFRVEENEEEWGWRSDFNTLNRFGSFAAGLRVVRQEADFRTRLDGPWTRFIYESDDPRPAGQRYIVWQPEQINAQFASTGTNVSAYVEQAFTLGRFDVRPGLRVDRDDFSAQTYTAPRLSIGYEASPVLRLSLTAGVFHESPRFLVRAANPANFDLKNEEIRHLGLGLDYQLGAAWNLVAEIYYQALDDLVVDEGRTTQASANAGEGTNTGFDLVLRRAFGDRWSADMTYSYNRARLDDNDGRGRYTADFSRDHFFAVGGRWEITDRLQIGARWKWGSGRPGDASIVHEDVLPGSGLLRFSREITGENAITLGDYQSLNVRLDYRRRLGPMDVVAFVDIINIYGAEKVHHRNSIRATGNWWKTRVTPSPCSA